MVLSHDHGGPSAGDGRAAPAIVETGKGHAVAVTLDPFRKGRWNARLVGRDVRTGAPKWARPVHSTFGPQQCGPFVCVPEHTALSAARVVVLDPATGAPAWKIPGIAEVEWADATRAVFLRMARNPVLEAYDLRTGKPLWRQPIERALGAGVDLSGGWSFGATSEDLVGYVAPYTNPRTKKVSTFGLFSVRLSDGGVNWMRPSVVRVYPSGNPGYVPVVRPVDQRGQYGGFARLDAESGRVLGQIPASQVPASGWWLAFLPDGQDRLPPPRQARDRFRPGHRQEPGGQGAEGLVLLRHRSQAAPPQGTAPRVLLGGLAVRVRPGHRQAHGERRPPPGWFTGSQGGWRVWRDEKGGLHAVNDATVTSPGMYG
nr:PQQ-binding-like beta-propeller repeat protein [Planobispora longispora]